MDHSGTVLRPSGTTTWPSQLLGCVMISALTAPKVFHPTPPAPELLSAVTHVSERNIPPLWEQPGGSFHLKVLGTIRLGCSSPRTGTDVGEGVPGTWAISRCGQQDKHSAWPEQLKDQYLSSVCPQQPRIRVWDRPRGSQRASKRGSRPSFREGEDPGVSQKGPTQSKHLIPGTRRRKALSL